MAKKTIEKEFFVVKIFFPGTENEFEETLGSFKTLVEARDFAFDRAQEGNGIYQVFDEDLDKICQIEVDDKAA